ncbi:TlpA family protein disulfide reductase [Desertivirga brevis]|uniref:TlpA family protein disulfide reductase n=1 Tax=Desertivirga brevis TaxID=2810310 RepID=UPI001A966CCE|nr:TlpA disulfide reductase family protein [Pedobacter sp. SYSU D00873]
MKLFRSLPLAAMLLTAGIGKAQNSNEKLREFKVIAKTRNADSVLMLTTEFIDKYPYTKTDTAFDKRNWIDYSRMYQTVGILTSVKKDFSTYKKYVATAPFNSLSTIFYKAVEIPYDHQKSSTAEEVLPWAKLVMERIENFKDGKPAENPYLSSDDWDKMFSNVYASSSALYADILLHVKQYKEGLYYAEIAQQRAQFKKAPLNEVYSLLLKETGNTAKLKETLVKSMQQNQASPAVIALLKEQYVQENKTGDGFEAYISNLKDNTLTGKLEAKVKKSMINQELPEFKALSNAGEMVSLKAQKGKVVVLDFFASWCAPCKEAFPGMDMVRQKYLNDKNVVFYFVDTQERRTDYKEYVAKYLKEHNFDFTVLFDADAKLAKSFGVGAIPHKMVIDPNGKLRFSEVGYMGSPSELSDEISMMIELSRKSK